MFKVFGFLLKFKNTSKKAFDSLKKDLDKVKDAGDSVKESFGGMKKKLSDGISGVSASARRAGNALSEFAQENSKVIGAFSENFGGVLGTLTEALGGKAGIVGIAALAGAAIGKVGMSFEKATKRIGAQTGLQGEALQQYSDAIKDVVIRTGASSDQVGSIMVTLAKRNKEAYKYAEGVAENIVYASRVTGVNVTQIAEGLDVLRLRANLTESDMRGLIASMIKGGQETRASTDEMISTLNAMGPLMDKIPESMRKSYVKTLPVIQGLLSNVGADFEGITSILTKGSVDLSSDEFKRLSFIASRAGDVVHREFVRSMGQGDIEAGFEALLSGINNMNVDEIRKYGDVFAKIGLDMTQVSKLQDLSVEQFRELKDAMAGAAKDENFTKKAAEESETAMSKLFQAFNRLSIALEPIGTVILETLAEMLDGVSEIFEIIGDIGGSFGLGNILTGLVKVVVAANPIMMVFNLIKGILKILSGDLSGIGDILKTTILRPVIVLLEHFGVLESVTSALQVGWDAIVSSLAKAVEWIGEAWDFIFGGEEKSSSGSSSQSQSSSMSIQPKLASGGIVMPNNHGVNATIAEGGRPEIVANPEMMRKIIGTDDLINTLWETTRFLATELVEAQKVAMDQPGYKPRRDYDYKSHNPYISNK